MLGFIMGLYDTITFEHLRDTDQEPFVNIPVRPDTGYIEFQTKSFYDPYLAHYHVKDNKLYTVGVTTEKVDPYKFLSTIRDTKTRIDYSKLIPYLDEQTKLPYHGTVYCYVSNYDFAAYFIHGEFEKMIQL